MLDLSMDSLHVRCTRVPHRRNPRARWKRESVSWLWLGRRRFPADADLLHSHYSNAATTRRSASTLVTCSSPFGELLRPSRGARRLLADLSLVDLQQQRRGARPTSQSCDHQGGWSAASRESPLSAFAPSFKCRVTLPRRTRVDKSSPFYRTSYRSPPSSFPATSVPRGRRRRRRVRGRIEQPSPSGGWCLCRGRMDRFDTCLGGECTCSAA